jgi:hypothetical protein
MAHTATFLGDGVCLVGGRAFGAGAAVRVDDAMAARLSRLTNGTPDAEPLFVVVPEQPEQPGPATPADVRKWAQENGVPVPDRGRIPAAAQAAYDKAHEQE